MTSDERSSWRALPADLARVEEALAGGRVTADDPDGRSLQSFALALREAAPRPREAFVAMLERKLRDDFACAAAVARHERADESPAPLVPARRRRDARRRAIRVVVAEDHPLVREGVIRALERDPGIEVIAEADNGLTAMELARELKPDVMVLDLRMPGLGGAVVLERLRAEMPEIKALVMTANESPESLLDAVAAGAAGYLSKRTTGEELRQAVITTYGGGSVITPELAGHLLREFSGSARGEGSSVRPLLAARELEILRLVADGLTDNEIGKQLYISPRTVQNHLTRIREKTKPRSSSRLARWAASLRSRGEGSAW